MTKTLFEQFCDSKELKLTSLRKDVLHILYSAKKPIGAYDILEKLKKKRGGAEPPTVYRVLKWLVDAHCIHRIESQNAYVCCSKLEDTQNSHKTILLLCKQCERSYEFKDDAISRAIKRCVEKHKIEVDDTIIEMNGLCSECSKKISRR